MIVEDICYGIRYATALMESDHHAAVDVVEREAMLWERRMVLFIFRMTNILRE